MLGFTKPELRNLLNVILITAFVLSGISPACKFMSGNAMLVEICKADGSVEVVSLDFGATGNEGAPIKNTPADHQNMKNDCAFCFADSNIKTVAADDFNAILPLYNGQSGILKTRETIAKKSANHLYAARAPPVFVV